MPHVVTFQLPDKHNLQKFLQTRIVVMEYLNCTSFTILYFDTTISYEICSLVYQLFFLLRITYMNQICITNFTLSHSIHCVWKVNTDLNITTRKLSKYNLHARQHNFNAFSFICVMFMFLSFKERHKNISLEWLLPVAVVDW